MIVMRKYILTVLVLSLGMAVLGQPLAPSQSDYLRKSKNKNTAAWVLLAGGFACSGTGTIIIVIGAVDNLSTLSNSGKTKLNIGSALVITGLIAMAGSIPMFISASANKKKARKLSAFFRIDHVPTIMQHTGLQIGYPALGVRVSL